MTSKRPESTAVFATSMRFGVWLEKPRKRTLPSAFS